MCQCSGPAVPDRTVVIENLLKLGGGAAPLPCCKVRISTYVCWIQTRIVDDDIDLAELYRRRLQGIERGSRSLIMEGNLSLDRREPERLHLCVEGKTCAEIASERAGL